MPGKMVSTPWARSFKVATIFSWLSHSWGRRLGSKEMGSSKALARLISRLVAARALGETAGENARHMEPLAAGEVQAVNVVGGDLRGREPLR